MIIYSLIHFSVTQSQALFMYRLLPITATEDTILKLEVVRVYHHDVYYIPQFSSISLSLWSMHNTLHSVFLAKNLSHILMKAFYLFCYLGKIFGMTQYMTEVSKHCCIH